MARADRHATGSSCAARKPLPCLVGATHVIFESLDIMYRMYGMPWAQGCAGTAISRLVVLVPRPRVHLTRFHGLFASNSNYLTLVTPLIQGEVEGSHLLGMAGWYWQQSSYSKNAKFNGTISSSRPAAGIYVLVERNCVRWSQLAGVLERCYILAYSPTECSRTSDTH